MSITAIKNAGANIVNAGNTNGQGGGMDFNAQLAELKRISEEATMRSLVLRATYTDLNSKKKTADERVN